MDALLTDKSCVASYLLEYGLYRYERNKRESVLSSALISPALNPDTTSYNIVLVSLTLKEGLNINYVT